MEFPGSRWAKILSRSSEGRRGREARPGGAWGGAGGGDMDMWIMRAFMG
jgi:hypothetical protein